MRFLCFVLGLWIAGRAVMWTLDDRERFNLDAGQQREPPTTVAAAKRSSKGIGTADTADVAKTVSMRQPRKLEAVPKKASASIGAERPLFIAAGSVRREAPKGIFNRPADFPPIASGEPSTSIHSPNRWSASAWMLYRPDNSGPGLASGGQLGASQVGIRIAYDLTPSQTQILAVHGRVASALDSPQGVEAALGLTYRPKRSLPVALSLERRIALAEGGRNAFAAYGAGGVGPVAVNPDLEMEGYAQAGIVGLAGIDAFADGRFALSKRLADIGSRSLLAGLAVSGGAQPGLSRLDAGPHVSARSGSARAVLEWRQRIGGGAFPGSGPALIVAADF